jgi:hypothetical protein
MLLDDKRVRRGMIGWSTAALMLVVLFFAGMWWLSGHPE